MCVPVSGKGCFLPYHGSIPWEASQGKKLERQVLDVVEFEFTALAGCQHSFQEKTLSNIILQSNIKGNEVLAVNVNETLLCALVQMK